jgi:two-component system phosphate regulon response regulator PhoB
MLPGKSGVEFCKQLKAQKKYADLPFLMLTSHSHEDTVIGSIQAGVDGYLVKPWKKSALDEKIKATWKKAYSIDL